MKTALLVTDAYLVGLSVVVALVVYPAFRLVGPSEWPTFHRRHTKAMGLAVAPVWFLQGVFSAWWILSGADRLGALVHGSFALFTVVATAFGAVPQHNRLAAQQSAVYQDNLEMWHWLRTMAWIAALAVVLAN